MIENNPTNVVAAFEMLLEEVEAEIEFINKVGAKAFEERNYDRAKEALERAAQLTAYRDKVAALRKEWDALAAAEKLEAEEDKALHAERRNLGRLKRGLRTPEETYYQPILKTLAQMGGSGKMNDVLVLVEKSMKGTLKKVDYEPLASDPEMLRWRNSAQWARNTMVTQGLLKSTSPRGTWEISQAGRKTLSSGQT